MALRVSKLTTAPSRSIRGAPSTEITNPAPPPPRHLPRSCTSPPSETATKPAGPPGRNDLGTAAPDAGAMTPVIEIDGSAQGVPPPAGPARRWPSTGSTSRCPPAGCSGSSGRTGRGRRPRSAACSGSTRPTAGTCRLLGVPTPAQVGRVIGRVGAIVETPALFPTMSGRRNLDLLGRVDGIGPQAVDRVARPRRACRSGPTTS